MVDDRNPQNREGRRQSSLKRKSSDLRSRKNVREPDTRSLGTYAIRSANSTPGLLNGFLSNITISDISSIVKQDFDYSKYISLVRKALKYIEDKDKLEAIRLFISLDKNVDIGVDEVLCILLICLIDKNFEDIDFYSMGKKDAYLLCKIKNELDESSRPSIRKRARGRPENQERVKLETDEFVTSTREFYEASKAAAKCILEANRAKNAGDQNLKTKWEQELQAFSLM